MTEKSDEDHTRRLLEELDGSGSDREWMAVEELRRKLGDNLPCYLHQKYKLERKAAPRSSCVYHSVRYARTSQEAIELGLAAIFDRSKIVRYRGCMLLAYAQKRDVLPKLKQALEAIPRNSYDDLLAAIDAIEYENHNYFVDRDHSGLITLNVA